MNDPNGVIVAVCKSDVKGVGKTEVDCAMLVPDFGLENDAHAGNWHRQVSLLDYGQVEAFNAKGGEVDHGAFGENILVSGIDLKTLPVGTRLKVEPAILEVNQICKECHNRCQIFYRVGDCIMPREGIFAKVITGGDVRKGDPVTLIPLGD